MKVADLYGELGIRENQRSWAKARRDLDDLAKHAERAGKRAGDAMSHGLSGRDANGRFLPGARRGGGFGGSGGGSTPYAVPSGGGRGIFSRLAGAGMGMGSGIASFAGGMGVPLPALAAGAAGAGAFAVGRDAFGFDEQLTRLAISSRDAMGPLDMVRAKILKVSDATGVAKEGVTESAATFVALTGDGVAASQSLETFARVNKATGASMKETATVAATLADQFGLHATEFEKGFSILAKGGKEGAVEFSDMASLMAELGAGFKPFGESQGIRGLSTLGGLFQIVRKDSGSAAQAQTRLNRMFEAFSSPRTLKALKEVGVKVFEIGADGKQHLRPVLDILDDMGKTALATDSRKLNKLFESAEARGAARSLMLYQDELKGIIRATQDAKDIAEDYARVQESSSARVAKAWNSAKISIVEAIDPEGLEFAADVIAGSVATFSGALALMKSEFEAKKAAAERVFSTKGEPAQRAKDDDTVLGEFRGMSDERVASQARLGNMGAILEIERRKKSNAAARKNRTFGPYTSELQALAQGSRPDSPALNWQTMPSRAERMDAARKVEQTNTVTINVTVGAGADGRTIGNEIAKHLGFFLDQEKAALGAL